MRSPARVLALLVLVLGLAPLARAIDAPQGPSAPPQGASSASEWDPAFAAFAAADRASPPPEGAVLFVGSSSIRLWTGLEAGFGPDTVVLKRGFGGSRLSDCVSNLNRLVIGYKPRMVMVYAGDNDLAAGAEPADVLKRFAQFVEGVHRALPATRIDYISIKPSPARIELLGRIRATNALIRDYIAGDGRLQYVDVHAAMLDASGRPRSELFGADGLHLNAEGYALWTSIMAPYVRNAAR